MQGCAGGMNLERKKIVLSHLYRSLPSCFLVLLPWRLSVLCSPLLERAFKKDKDPSQGECWIQFVSNHYHQVTQHIFMGFHWMNTWVLVLGIWYFSPFLSIGRICEYWYFSPFLLCFLFVYFVLKYSCVFPTFIV